MIPHNLHVALRFYLFSCFFHQKTHPYVHFHPGQPSITHLPFAVFLGSSPQFSGRNEALCNGPHCMHERRRRGHTSNLWGEEVPFARATAQTQLAPVAWHASQLYGLCETLKVPKSAKKSVGLPKASLRISLSN